MNEQAQTMKRDAELYTYIYQNARMGLVGINQVRGTVSDAELTKELCDEYAMYDEYSTTAENALRDLGEESKDIGAIAKKMGSFISTKMNTAVDSTVSHIAAMMIEGTTMGVTKLSQKITAMKDCSPGGARPRNAACRSRVRRDRIAEKVSVTARCRNAVVIPMLLL